MDSTQLILQQNFGMGQYEKKSFMKISYSFLSHNLYMFYLI